jgi:hypothetical protein
VQGLLASPRRRRQLGRLGLALAAVTAAVGIVLWNPGRPEPLDEDALTPAGPELTAEPATPFRVTPEIRREVGTTVERFVGTAVVRRNLDEAWRLASPAMREGVTRAAWRAGELPVLPYPEQAIRHVDWRITYAEGNTIGVDVMVLPKAGSGERTIVYAVELADREPGANRRWLVDSWIPAATLGGPATAGGRSGGQGGSGEREEAADAEPQLAFDDARLSTWWFLVPGFFLALLLLTPLVLAARSAVSRRRADRRYRDWGAG